MLTEFIKVFQLNFQHEYFNYSSMTSIIKVTPVVADSLLKVGIRQTESGYFVFIQAVDEPKEKLEWVSVAISLAIEVTEASFFNFTDIDFTPGNIIYFNSEETSNLITKAAEGTMLSADSAQAIGSHILPHMVFEWKGDITATNEVLPTYTLSFKARSTYWRYLFVNMDQQDWDDLTITSIVVNDQTISFSKEKQISILPDGRSAFVALSSSPIPLQERPAWNIKLSSKRFPEGLRLPCPEGNNLSSLETKDDKPVYYSDVYTMF